MINNFLILLVLSLPFGQLTRLSLFRPEIHFYLHDIIMVFLIIWGLIKKRANLKNLFKNPLNSSILAFFLMAAFSLLINSVKYQLSEILISSLYLIRWLAYAFIYLLFKELCKKPAKAKFGLYRFLIYSSLALAIFGFLQYFLFPDFGAFEAYDWDPHYYRLLSTLFDPGFTGMMLVLALILLVVYEWQMFMKLKLQSVHLIFLIIYLALAFTYSRSAYLAYLVGFLIISLKKKNLAFVFYSFVFRNSDDFTFTSARRRGCPA